jgi:hypothetical protein
MLKLATSFIQTRRKQLRETAGSFGTACALSRLTDANQA